MVDDVCRPVPVVDQVVELASRSSARPVLVRSLPGGGADLVARAAATRLTDLGCDVVVVESVADVDDAGLLELRARRRTHVLLLAHADTAIPARVGKLIEYLQPRPVDVGALDLDRTRRVIDVVLGERSCTDELAATVRVASAGRLADVVDVARFLRDAVQPAATLDEGCSLAGFRPTDDRLAVVASRAPAADVDAWAIATAELVPGLAVRHGLDDLLRPVDATVVRDRLGSSQRIVALRTLCADAAILPAGSLGPEEQVTVAGWWCEIAADTDGLAPISGPELHALLPGVMTAVELGRWTVARRIAERLWQTTRVALAGTAVAASLARATPSPLLDEVTAAHPDDETLVSTAAFTRALWQLYLHHDPDAARSTLDRALEVLAEHREICEDGLATIDLHTGDPDAVERRVGDRSPQPGRPTSFALNTLALADLVRGRHQRVLDRLDTELERQLQPGMNLSADRYRFVRSLVFARSGLGEPAERAELDRELGRLFEGSLRRGDDWNLGWTAWATGQRDARAGRSVGARRRLRTAIVAYHRAHRPGFADWPLATLVAVSALHEGENLAGATDVELAGLRRPSHAVAAERADALLALALHARRDARPRSEVATMLADAMSVAHRQREVVTGHLVAVEQLLFDITPATPPDDPAADGPVLEACRRALTCTDDEIERAAMRLIELDWSVLGVRLLALVAERVRRDDPRRATRVLQTVRTVTEGFDEPLRPWVLSTAPLPTLSARELEVARGVASGASRDELAEALVLSRRTIDSHLQRVYAKLGISSRAELRDWLDR